MGFEQIKAGYISCDECDFYYSHVSARGEHSPRLVYFSSFDQERIPLVDNGWYIVETGQVDPKTSHLPQMFFLCPTCAGNPDKVQKIRDKVIKIEKDAILRRFNQ